MRADRRRLALAGHALHRDPGGDSGHSLGRHLRVHAVVERVHLRARLPVLARAENRAGRRHVGADPRRCVLLGTADGGRPVGIDTGRHRLFILRRALRRRTDRIGERLNRMGQVVLKGINKFYDSVHAVKDVNLQIRDKEFVVFVGPSGCGKTTTLRMIAGLEAISSGDISIDGNVINALAPMDRDIAMVFQNYALYPHMSVYDNMAFGLKMRKFERPEIDRRVRDAADILGIGEFLKRKPRQLSGGQRQRVALGRAVVRHPRVFRSDEPLSNLDAKLRVQMRVELKKLHLRLGTTAIYVTHDQVEAMTLGDGVVVMKDGVVQQVGEPLDLYNQPANRFVAGFIGSPAMNFAAVTVTEANGSMIVENSGLHVKLPDEMAQRLRSYIGHEVTFGVRPEDLTVADVDDLDNPGFDAVVEVIEQLGSEILLDMKVGDGVMVASVEPTTPVKVRDRLRLAMRPSRLHIFDAKTEGAI